MLPRVISPNKMKKYYEDLPFTFRFTNIPKLQNLRSSKIDINKSINKQDSILIDDEDDKIIKEELELLLSKNNFILPKIIKH